MEIIDLKVFYTDSDSLLPDVGGSNVMNILAINEDKWIAGSKLAEDHPPRWEVEVNQGRGGWGITGGGCYEVKDV